MTISQKRMIETQTFEKNMYLRNNINDNTIQKENIYENSAAQT